MSREIIQFDQAMFESKLDAMVREKVERIVNAMPDASGGRDRQRREIRAFRRTEGVPGRPLRAEPDRQGRQARAQGVCDRIKVFTGGWCRFVGLPCSCLLHYAMKPSLRRRSMMPVPYSVLIRLSRYQTM